MGEVKNSNGVRRLGEWVIDKLMIVVLALLASLIVWLVSQVYAINTDMDAIRLENAEKLHNVEIQSAAKIAGLESDIKVIIATTRRTEERLNEVCKELKVR